MHGPETQEDTKRKKTNYQHNLGQEIGQPESERNILERNFFFSDFWTERIFFFWPTGKIGGAPFCNGRKELETEVTGAGAEEQAGYHKNQHKKTTR